MPKVMIDNDYEKDFAINTKYLPQFVKDKTIFYKVNKKHGLICKLYIVQLLQSLFWIQMSFWFGLIFVFYTLNGLNRRSKIYAAIK